MRTLIATTLSVVLLAAPAAVVVGQDDPGASGPESELARLEAELAAVTAERDVLLAEQDAAATRHDKCQATTDELEAIMADPGAYGTPTETLDRLDALAAPGTVYGDVAFGETTWRDGWYNTIFAGHDANIHTWKDWLSDDGSEGGSLWTWAGTAMNGEPFVLHGIALFTCNEDGLHDWTYVYYPYANAEVKQAFYNGNQAE